MAQEKEYFAFISYQRKDEEWADRLRSKLEHYRLPSSVRKQDASLPKEIRPIFRDALELAGGVLAKEIETALKQSKFLIVICSPNSAISPWVNKEVQTFIGLGREDRIIPFIIDGTPFSDNEDTECFPPALRSLKGEKELLGININELSRDAASIKVVARMFGLKFDALWQRDEREKRRKRLASIITACIVAGIGIFIAWIFANKNNTIRSQNRRLIEDSINLSNHISRILKDSLSLVNHITRIREDSIMLSSQKDSISQQNEIILLQKSSLSKTNMNLVLSNKLLKEKQDSLEQSNWEIMRKQARIVAGIANDLIDKGDYYTARLLALEILPDSQNDDKPYIPEAETVLRRASEVDAGIMQFGSMEPRFAQASILGDKTAICDGRKISIIDNSTGKIVSKLDDYYNSPIFSPYIKMMAYDSVANDGKIKIVTQDLKSLQYHIYSTDVDKTISKMTFSIDSKDLLYSTDSIVYKLDLKTSENRKFLCGHTDKVNQINFAHEWLLLKHYLIVTASSDSTVKVWDSITGKLLRTLNGHSQKVRIAMFSWDDHKIISADNNKIIVWDTFSGDSLYSVKTDKYIDDISLVGNDHSFITITEGVLTEYNLNNGDKIGSLNDKYYNSWNSVNQWGDYISIFDDEYLSFHRRRNRHQERPRIAKFGVLTNDVSFSNDGKYIIAALEDSSIMILNNAARPLKSFIGHKGGVLSAIFSPDGNHVVSVSTDSTIKIWNVNTREAIQTIPNHKGWNKGISFSKDGRYMSSISLDGDINIYETSTWSLYKSLNGHRYSLSKAIISLDGKRVVSISPDNRLVVLWDIEKEKELFIDSVNLNPISMACSPNERFLALQTIDSILLWDLKLRRVSKRWRSSGLNIAFSPDGRWIVNSGLREINIWDAYTGILIKTFTEHSGLFGGVCVDGQGKYIVADYNSQHESGIELWYIEPLNALISQTRRRMKYRKLSKEERLKYYLD